MDINIDASVSTIRPAAGAPDAHAAGRQGRAAPGASSRIRQIHRWVSIAFTLTVIANFAALAAGAGAPPPPWITYAPLPPLLLLLLSGLYMFALPYAARWRSGRRAG